MDQENINTNGITRFFNSMVRRLSAVHLIRLTKAVLMLRARAPKLVNPDISGIRAVMDPRSRTGANSKNVTMVVFNDIEFDGRVIKTARTLQQNAFDITLLGMNRAPGGRGYAKTIGGIPAIIFPNPLSCLVNVKLPALKWEFTIAYMKAAMWSYVELLSPTYIHTHDYHSIPIGHDFIKRIRHRGHSVHWIHDFHEWVPGYDYMDEEWRSNILSQERQGIPLMDYRFTVSPDISKFLTRSYDLATPPTVVLNVPASNSTSTTIGTTVRTALELGLDENLIVYSGGVSEQRGIHTVVETLAYDEHWHLALLTNDKNDYTDRLVAIAAKEGYKNRLHFLPYVKPHEVPTYIRDATVGVLPFRRYGNSDVSLPNKLFDYLHAGLPMVASNCVQIEQFINRHGVGEIFKADDVADCAEKLKAVIAHRSRYMKEIHSSQELLRLYSWEAEEKKLLHAYEALGEMNGRYREQRA